MKGRESKVENDGRLAFNPDKAMGPWLDHSSEKVQHAFVMVGTEPLFVCHLTMFAHPVHRYQMVMTIGLDEKSLRTFVADRDEHPSKPYFLGNTEDMWLARIKGGRTHEFKADVFRGIPDKPKYESWPWENEAPILANIKVEVRDIVYFRQFDFDVPTPEDLTYILFGSEKAKTAYLTHYQSAWPDFDEVITLAQPPQWIKYEEIEAGVPITFRGMKTRPGGLLHCTSPISKGTHPAHYDGAGHAPLFESGPIAVDRIDWFSTKIVNIPNDPCYVGTSDPAPHHDHLAGAAGSSSGRRHG